MTYQEQKEVDRILEDFRNNPSNSNKYRYELYAYIDELIEAGGEGGEEEA
jgi:hypothetical protein